MRDKMTAPASVIASRELIEGMDETVLEQLRHVASLPGIIGSVWALPDAHVGYGFPIGTVAAFDADAGGVISAGGIGFDIGCGVRMLLTGITKAQITPHLDDIARQLQARIPAGMGQQGRRTFNDATLDDMLTGGAHWAVRAGFGLPEDLARIEYTGHVQGAEPAQVSSSARLRQRQAMGTLGSGNHYLEVQTVAHLEDPETAKAFGLRLEDVVISLHCGSRGLGHQVGTDYLRLMASAAASQGIELPDRSLACAPIHSETAQRYLGAMRAAMNCALANRQIITHDVRQVLHKTLPEAAVTVLYDTSHNTCLHECHWIDETLRWLYVHRKGATRALPPLHPELPGPLRATGQPVFVGGSMGTASWVMAGMAGNERLAFSSACHGAGRMISRHAARKSTSVQALRRQLTAQGIRVRCASTRGLTEEAPDAYKDVDTVAEVTERAGLARRVARLLPLICIKG